ncbi:MAG: hypothetical protein WC055_01535 [Melioribacteraceae bacterium]
MLSKLSRIIKKPTSILQYALSTAFLSALLLIIPLTAKIISEEMKWSIFDFFAAWSLIFIASFIYRMASKNVNNITYKAAIALSVFSGLFLIWSNLAVGLMGNENNSINLVYPGVLAIGTLGAIVTRLQPRGMAIVLFIMAFSHLIISALALIAGVQYAPESSVTEILAVNGFFAFLWTASGLLFLNTVKENANSKV